MINVRLAPYGALVLRIPLGLLFFIHAGLKTPAETAQFLTSLGLPAALAYVVMSAELIGGLALMLGIFTSIAALDSWSKYRKRPPPWRAVRDPLGQHLG